MRAIRQNAFGGPEVLKAGFKTALYAAIGFAVISSIVLAEDVSSAPAPLPLGTFTRSAHSDEWKIANALSAGPAIITEHATVVDWRANPRDRMSHGRVLRQGNNGWTCMPDVPGRALVQTPIFGVDRNDKV